MNEPRPGSASEDSPATSQMPARPGTMRCQPPKSGMRLLRLRLMSIPAKRNRPAVEKPWLSM